ncbi:Rqc2 family fibronectin-binding protein [Caldinitratiruptor microaerophilus]|uniref:Rqc2 homolog RqcH n=1 Tax=Caldinitratiruptor microaerophilus TaxID=671077 RepID=A0AA35G8Q4_9FIRM|nr:NFACT family protein [Caldinitratiruptor microaerophilus]BDG60678.1 hypothetical protein caldi_17680 [Caldinitratiruptor microaerophilus]
MGFDGLTTAAVVRELQAAVGARLTRIHQPRPFELTLGLHLPPGTEAPPDLLLSCHPRHARAHLSQAVRRNPPRPPAFAALLRSRIGGGRIERVRQPGRERVISIDVSARDDLGNPVTYTLVAELMGRNSNVVLLAPASGPDEDPHGAGRRIVDAIRRAGAEQNAYRTVLPGQPYVPPPPPGKLDPLALDPAALSDRLRAADAATPAWQAVLACVDGIGPLAAREVAARAGLEGAPAGDLDKEGARRLAAAAAALWQEVLAGEPRGFLLYDPEGRLADFAPFRPVTWTGQVRAMRSLSAALDTFFALREEEEQVRTLAADLRRALLAARQRTARKAQAQEAELAEVGDPEQLRRFGETLLAHLWQVPRGAAEVTLPDLYDPAAPPVRIALDPDRTPAENAQAYFRRYQKARSARDAIAAQLERSRAALAHLEELAARLEQASSLPDLEAIHRELTAAGHQATGRGAAGGPAKAAPPRPNGASGPLVLRSRDGLEIWVGRSGRQNDELTLRLAAPTDVWLHAQKIPGAHVILRVPPGTEPTERSLEDAAVLAAFFSRARHSANVPVDYTLCRHVRKPPGARPGMVIYERQRTVHVTPDPERHPILRQLPEEAPQSPERPDTASG